MISYLQLPDLSLFEAWVSQLHTRVHITGDLDPQSLTRDLQSAEPQPLCVLPAQSHCKRKSTQFRKVFTHNCSRSSKILQFFENNPPPPVNFFSQNICRGGGRLFQFGKCQFPFPRLPVKEFFPYRAQLIGPKSLPLHS